MNGHNIGPKRILCLILRNVFKIMENEEEMEKRSKQWVNQTRKQEAGKCDQNHIKGKRKRKLKEI